MQIQTTPSFARLLPGGRGLRAVLLAGAIAVASVSAIACSDDGDDEPSGSLTAGAVATATPTSEAPAATVAPTRGGGTLSPAATPAPTLAASSSSGSTAAGSLESIAMYDFAPCGQQASHEEVALPGQVPALTYKEVPTGTPILFPFEHGDLRHVDAKEGAISLVYEVDDIGVVTIKAAGSGSLIRNIREPVAGTVIGHFGQVFGDEERDVFADAQLYAVAGTEEMVIVGDEYYAGQALDPEVTDCLPVP